MAKFFLKNPGFELGDQDWNKGSQFSILDNANARTGAWVGRWIPTANRVASNLPLVACRPGGKISISAYIKGGTAGNGHARLSWRDKDETEISAVNGSARAFGGGYAQSTLVDSVAPARTKFVSLEGAVLSSPTGTWYIDDFEASGNIIEAIPTSAKIQSHTMFLARTIGAFDPLIGDTKYSDFNAGMSDKWAGVFTFIPLLPSGNLGELLGFLERLGQVERFFASDPDRLIPKNGVVNGMLVDGPITNGTNKIPIKSGPVSSTALVAGDYMEVKNQYFQLLRDLEIGPEGTGEAIVDPTVRSTLADGEDVITDHPKMVARITSEVPRRSGHDKWTQLAVSWEEV